MRIKLSYIIFFLITTSLFSVSYNETRENFKLELYYCQQGLMMKNEYYGFIEPYIQEAEKTLKVTQYCMEHSDSQASKDYLECLILYNVAWFNEYARSHSLAFVFASKARKVSKKRLEERMANLLSAIENIKEEAQFKDLDTKEELRKTIQLFQRANAKYYKKLGIKFKLLYPVGALVSSIIWC